MDDEGRMLRARERENLRQWTADNARKAAGGDDGYVVEGLTLLAQAVLNLAEAVDSK